MKTLTAYTHEIDDVKLAVSEVLSQLDLEHSLFKNSVGIISCYPEFIESGVVAALCEALPFDVLGATTIADSASGEFGFTMLSLMVLTGDDVSFNVVLSDDITIDQEKTIQNMCKQALEGVDGEAKMALLYGPILNYISGEVIISIMDKACGGIPIFGTFASDPSEDYSNSHSIYNGKNYVAQAVMVAISGNVNPRFSVMSIPEEKVLRQKAVVTESLGNIIVSVNDMPFVEYMRTIGLVAEDTSIEGVLAIPVMVDYNNDTEPIAMAMLINPDGTASCGCQVPKGASLSVGTLTSDDIVAATQTIVKQVLDDKNSNAALMYSCLSRMLILGVAAEAEMEKISAGFSGKIPYMLAYSGGEICPVSGKDGNIANRIHNFSLVTCTF